MGGSACCSAPAASRRSPRRPRCPPASPGRAVGQNKGGCLDCQSCVLASTTGEFLEDAGVRVRVERHGMRMLSGQLCHNN
eukprot:8741291-Alexandrium_andersonii.AAC.1